MRPDGNIADYGIALGGHFGLVFIISIFDPICSALIVLRV